MDVSQEMNVSSLTQTSHYSSAIYLTTQSCFNIFLVLLITVLSYVSPQSIILHYH